MRGTITAHDASIGVSGWGAASSALAGSTFKKEAEERRRVRSKTSTVLHREVHQGVPSSMNLRDGPLGGLVGVGLYVFNKLGGVSWNPPGLPLPCVPVNSGKP
jgi:hypothetical protein